MNVRETNGQSFNAKHRVRRGGARRELARGGASAIAG